MIRRIERPPDHRRKRAPEDVASPHCAAVDTGHRDLLIGVSHPHRRGEIRGVAHEPGIAEILCGAGLAGGDLVLEAGPGAGTTPHIGLQHLVHETGALDRDRSFRNGRVLEDDRAVAVLDSLDEDGIDLESVVGEGGVRRCHLQWGDVLRAERHRDRQVREVSGDTERLGGFGDVR